MIDDYPTKEVKPTAESVIYNCSKLLNHFDLKVDPRTDPDLFLDAIKQLNPRYQGDRTLVRFELESDSTEWDEVTAQVIMETAHSLGMLDPETPLVGEYDLIIVLGAARQANLDRMRYAAEAINSGAASTSQLIIAGSSRELGEAERDNVANYAPNATTEYDLCTAAAYLVSTKYRGINVDSVFVNDVKANTPSVIKGVLQGLKKDGNPSIAAVTTQIYTTATQLDLARVAGEFGISETFTAGNPSDPKIVESRTTASYLSEVLRTLRSAVNCIHPE